MRRLLTLLRQAPPDGAGEAGADATAAGLARLPVLEGLLALGVQPIPFLLGQFVPPVRVLRDPRPS